jgi:hypothetical protein
MHSHFDIEPRDGGFALVRSFEIDEQMLGEYGLEPSGEQEWGWTTTLDRMHDWILDPKFLRGPFRSDALEPKIAGGDRADDRDTLENGNNRVSAAMPAAAAPEPEADGRLRQAMTAIFRPARFC